MKKKAGEILSRIGIYLCVVSPFLSSVPFDTGIALFFLGYLLQEERFNFLKEIDRPYFFLFLTALFSIFFSPSPLLTLLKMRFFRFFLLIPLLKFYLLKHGGEELIQLSLIAGILTGIYITITTILNIKTAPFYLHYHFENDGRIIPQWSHVFSFYLFLSSYLLLKRRFLTPSILFLIASLPIIILSKTRSTFLSLFCTAFIIPFFTSRKFLVVPITLSFFLFLYIHLRPSSEISGLVMSVIFPFNPSTPRYASNMERVKMIKDAFSRDISSILTGIGFDSYVLVGKTKYHRVFSDIIQTFLCTGIPGLLAFLYSLLHWIKESVKLSRDGNFVPVCVTAAFIIGGLLEPHLYNTETLLAFLFLITYFKARNEDEKQS